LKTTTRLVAPLLLALVHATGHSAGATLEQDLTVLIHDYDVARFDIANEDARNKAYEALIKRADVLVKQNPSRAEPLVWKGMVEAELSAAERSLGVVKQARTPREASLAISPNPYATDAYATLGAMYANVPGFPLAFGDKKKARALYQKALAVDATSLRLNLNYAQLLFKQDDYASAVKYATTALSAPPRPGRDKADKAAYAKAQEVIAQSQAKLK